MLSCRTIRTRPFIGARFARGARTRVRCCSASTAAVSAHVQGVSVAVALAIWDPGPIAHAACVILLAAAWHAVAPIAARAVPAAGAARVLGVSVAVALAIFDSGPIAHAAFVRNLAAVCHAVAPLAGRVVPVAGAARVLPAPTAHAAFVVLQAAVCHAVAPRAARVVPSHHTAIIFFLITLRAVRF